MTRVPAGLVALAVLAVLLSELSDVGRARASLPVMERPEAPEQLGVWRPPPDGPQSLPRFIRLPGVCRRLRRRRITVLCNLGQLCLVKRNRPGHVCRCPKGSQCSHFFLKSL
ncbi:cocaine- and amphetamine-regulated transcript protein [Lampris incognitus]|uniref:cocaine- and amphetamine-regulated transcript protein n=1 Tax=Lampris incognitus TaxID=2546036 RepID=UPI0024B4F329|nr:cocaine- and amphetamine-regulated transcript protein [Lampris incognitus]